MPVIGKCVTPTGYQYERVGHVATTAFRSIGPVVRSGTLLARPAYPGVPFGT